MDRFKTDKINDMYERILAMHSRWEFRKLRAEATAAQSFIVDDLKRMFVKERVWLSVDAHKPNTRAGSKEERIAAVLEPRYEQLMMYHYKGGYTPALEEELILARPRHDDLKDCLASVVEIAKSPSRRASNRENRQTQYRVNKRFGGIRRGY